MSIMDFVDSLRYRTYNSVRVNTGNYIVGDGMGNGTNIHCDWRLIRGQISRKRLNPVKVQDGNHDRTVSRLNTYVLYPKTDKAIVEISNRRGTHRIRLIKHQGKARSTILKERL